MHLVHVLLPTRDNDGKLFPASLHAEVRSELTQEHGGLTAFSRAPARGFWKSGGRTRRDDIIVLEIMVEHLDVEWWRSYRRRLETSFRQETIVVRAHAIEVI